MAALSPRRLAVLAVAVVSALFILALDALPALAQQVIVSAGHAASGRIVPVNAVSSGSSGNGTTVAIVIVVAALVVIVGAVALGTRRRRGGQVLALSRSQTRGAARLQQPADQSGDATTERKAA